MNAGRQGSNGWILCPSKTFPNKLYYFNVHTGEAAWSLNDVEKSNMSKTFYQQAGNWQSYPEPDTPPVDANPWPTFRPPQNYRPGYPTPVFGQAAFPKYTPNLDTNILWAPVQVPTVSNRPFHQIQHWSDPACAHTGMQMSYERFDKPNHLNRSYSHEESMRNWVGVGNYQMSNRAVFATKPQSQQLCRKQAPVFGQMFAPKTTNIGHVPKQVIKQPIFRRTRTKSESQAYQGKSNIFGSKSVENITNLDFQDIAAFSPPRRTNPMLPPLENKHAQTLYQNNISNDSNFVSKSLENLSLFDDTGISNTNTRKRQLFNQSQTCIFSSNPQSFRNSNELHDSEPEIPELSSRKRMPFAIGKMNQNSTLPAKDIQFEETEARNSNIKQTNKRNISQDVQSQNVTQEFDATDLRYMLMAKRKKVEVNLMSKTGNLEGKKVKTAYGNDEKNEATTKKRVTFDLGVDSDQEDTATAENNENSDILDSSEHLNINSLNKLADPSANTDHWYIVVDTEVLLEDFEFVDKFVQSDGKCTLLIPHAVRAEIDAMSLGDCRGRQRVMAARQLSRRLATLPHYITVESPQDQDKNNESFENHIINCCLRIMNGSYHVVLLTNNEDLYNKANSVNIHCYRLQEIKDGDVAKPEVSFELKKIQKCLKQVDVKEKNNNLFFQVANKFNPFASKDFPVNCFRKRLFDGVNENSSAKNTDTNRQTDNNKNTDFSDFDDIENQQQTMLPPKNITSHKKSIFEDENEILNLNSKLKAFEIQTDRDQALSSEKQLADKEMSPEKENIFLKHTQATTAKPTDNGMKIKSINGYTIEAHLKRFYVKNRAIEEKILLRMEEWLCSFSQIMDDTLTELLQHNTAPITNNLSPPWTLLEAIECLTELYGDHTSIRIIVDKLSALLFNGNSENGKLQNMVKPQEFMKVLGCGILLIKYLKTILPSSPILAEAEPRLEALLQDIEDPTVASDPVLTIHTPVLSRSEVNITTAERKNFVKKPSEVLDYLKKHFPEWRTYTEVANSAATKKELHLKAKEGAKIVRTNGKNINLLKLDNNKSMSYDHTHETLKSPELEHQITKPCPDKSKVNTTKECGPKKDQTKDTAPKMDNETGPTLLKNLALNSLGQNKIPVMKEIDIEKRENVNKDLLNMIDQMTSKSITKYYDIDSIIVRNKATDQGIEDLNTTKHANTFKPSKEGPKVVRKLDIPFAFKKPKDVTQKPTNDRIQNNKTLSNKIEVKPKTDASKNDGPKVVRNIKLIDMFEEKIRKKPDEKLDLDVLDYNDIDEVSVNDFSQRTVNNDEDNTQKLTKPNEVAKNIYNIDSNEPINITVENNDTAVGNNDIAALNNDKNAQNSDNFDGGETFKDSGVESDVIYPFVHSFFSGLSSAFQFIFDFIQSALNQFDYKMTNEKKSELYKKAMKVFLLLVDITQQLKSIVERESDEASPLKDLFRTCNDTRMSRYRQVITKCLEQAHILQNALKVMLTLTNDNYDINSNSSTSNIQYCNIFE